MLTNAYGQEVEPSSELDPEEFADYCTQHGISWGDRR